MGTTAGKQIVYHIQGSDYKQLQAYAQKVKQVMSGISAVRDVSLTDKAGSPETKLEVDQNMADELGVTPANVSATLNTLFSGVVVSQYTTSTDTYDVRLSIADNQSQNVDGLNGIYVAGANGLVPLNQVTKTSFSTSEATITRYEKEREIQISANLYGMSTGDFAKLFMKGLNEEVGIPDGIIVSSGGTEAAAGDGASQMVVACLMGILFIYLILAAQFESFMLPLSILLSLPLAIIGAIWAMYLTHSEVSMTAMIGLILLMGLVTKNAILLVDNAMHQRTQGAERKEALLMAGNIRLRPIMMTSLAMIFGMIPAALSSEMGSEITAPMAIVIIGGLISSTLLTLLVVPIMYTLLDDVQCVFTRFWKRITRKKAESMCGSLGKEEC
jgi:multidrug efflux pump subunit AcrB